MDRVTLRDIANLTGYSMNTVSKALNNKGRISEEALKRIRACAYEHGYQPNMMARSMRGSDNNLIGVLISDLSDSFFVSLLAGVEEEAAARGMTVLVQNAHEDASLQINGFRKLLSYGCQWYVITPVRDYRTVLPVLQEANIHFVIADRVGPGMDEMDRVSINNRGDSKRAVEALLRQGHRRIALVNRDLGVQTEIERTLGYREALKEYGIQPSRDLELLCPDEETAREQVRALMRREDRPSAVFVAIDKFACGVLTALQAEGIRVSEDLALFIYGDLEWTKLYSSQVSMVHRDIHELGRASVRVLMDRPNEGKGEKADLYLDSELAVYEPETPGSEKAVSDEKRI